VRRVVVGAGYAATLVEWNAGNDALEAIAQGREAKVEEAQPAPSASAAAAAVAESKEAEDEPEPIPEEDESIIVVEQPIVARPRPDSEGAESAAGVLRARGASTRPLIRLRIRRKRKEFGLRVSFNDREADSAAQSFRMRRDPNFLPRGLSVTLDAEWQFGPSAFSGHSNAGTQTQWARPVGRAVQCDGVLTNEQAVGAIAGTVCPDGPSRREEEEEDEHSRRRFGGSRHGAGGKRRRGSVTGSRAPASRGGEASTAGGGGSRRGTRWGGGGEAEEGEDQHELQPTTGDLAEFLRRVSGRVEAALSQNETLDVFGEDPVRMDAGKGAEGADAAAAALLLGAQGDGAFRETRNVMDLTLSNLRSIANVAWHPTLPSVMAVTPIPTGQGFVERLDTSGMSAVWHVLVFTLVDFGAQLALESPSEVMCIRWNPWDSGVIAGGTWSGQVVVWDIHAALNKIVRRRGTRGARARPKAVQGGEDGKASTAASAAAAVAATPSAAESSSSASEGSVMTTKGGTIHVQPWALSHADRSHSRPVTDLQWLPPNRHVSHRLDGFVTADAVPKRSAQFLSAASDGTLRVWDTRFRDRVKARGGAKLAPSDASGITGGLLPGAAALAATKEPDVEWTPLYSADLLSSARPVCVSKISLDPVDASGPVILSTEEGLMGTADWCPAGTGTSHQQVRAVEVALGKDVSFIATLASGSKNAPSSKGEESSSSKGAASSDAAVASAVDAALGMAAEATDAADAIAAGGSRVMDVQLDLGRPPLSLERCPLMSDVVLSVSEACFSIWRVGVRAPLFVHPATTARFTCGCFSPSRPGVVFIGRSDGVVDAWDLGDTTLRPTLSASVISTAVACIGFQQRNPPVTAATATPDCQSSASLNTEAMHEIISHKSKPLLLGVGDEKGNLHVLEIPSSLSRVTERDFSNVKAFLERESRRVMYFKARSAVRKVEADAANARAAQLQAEAEKRAVAEEAEVAQLAHSMGLEPEAVDSEVIAMARVRKQAMDDDAAFSALREALCAQVGGTPLSLGYGRRVATAASAAAAEDEHKTPRG
jgi:WD40 repeat protein